MIGDLVTPSNIALTTGALTGIVGLFVATLAYRGYRRNDSPMMRWLAVGIGLLTAGAFLIAIVVDQAGGSDTLVLLARGLVTVAGLSAVLYALLS